MKAVKNIVRLVSVSAVIVLSGCDISGSSEEEPDKFDFWTKQTVIIKNGKFKDVRDNEEYSVMKIDDDVWFAENLRYADSSLSKNLKGNLWCYENKADNCKKYGPLYSWTAAMNYSSDYLKSRHGRYDEVIRGVCPDNWHLPRDFEWERLRDKVDANNGPTLPGTDLKAVSGWESSDSAAAALNRFGFSALAAGRRNNDGGFMQTERYAYFWSGDELDEAKALGWTLRYDSDYLDFGEYYKEHGMSVRCILDHDVKVEYDGDLDQSYLKDIPHSFGKMEIEGESYKTVDIGEQTWMAENANVASLSGDCYRDSSKYCDIYGGLYDWETAKKVCPEGWRLPTTTDFNLLTQNAVSAKNLRSVDLWKDGTAESTDFWGFRALPAGGVEAGDYFDLASSAYFWTAGDESASSANQVMVYWISYYKDLPELQKRSPALKFSVRCIKE